MTARERSIDVKNLVGWPKLLHGFPWFEGKGQFPLPAYSEFMPPPRLGRRPYGEIDGSLFSLDDPFGWHISEVEMEYEIEPGLLNLTGQIVKQITQLGEGKTAYRIASQGRRNLIDNPYWPADLASMAGRLPHERYVTLLPVALSRTQDDKGRIRWTFFGGSEQGPERAFWMSFYSGPGQERDGAHSWLPRLISAVYGEKCQNVADLRKVGFRILPSESEDGLPHWRFDRLPSWTSPLLWSRDEAPERIRYVLTFRPFSKLPNSLRRRYLTGELNLLPFPGSLVFWGMPSYMDLQKEFPMAMQLPLQRLVARHGGPTGLRVPQAGWFYEEGEDFRKPEVQRRLQTNIYRRSSRWDRVRRHDNEVVLSTIEDTIARTLFSTDLDVMGLYGKPMARNCQIWTAGSEILLNGPSASASELDNASRTVAKGGTFRYRFQFPPMKVGRYDVFWQRPLAAYISSRSGRIEIVPDPLMGYLAGYTPGLEDLSHPIELWPRVMKREPYQWALRNYSHLKEHYAHQTALNILRVLDSWQRWGKRPLPRSLARQLLRLSERESLEEWLDGLPAKARDVEEGRRLRITLEECLEPTRSSIQHTSLPGVPPVAVSIAPVTFEWTAARSFETAWWNDIARLSQGRFTNKDNADCVLDSATLPLLTHRRRDLERLGDYLLRRYSRVILAADMEGKAACGELPFQWTTDFDFSKFGGWKRNQTGKTYERDIILVIPGKNRHEAVIMADHYDTAYMEDLYEKAKDGKGARVSAAGADDNYSATATLLQAAPIFLSLAKEGRLERDIWLVHLTGEEFPADCMGARHLAQSLVEKTLQMRVADGTLVDLSGVQVSGIFVLDMVGHNRDNYQDVFQISPGKGPASLQLAWQAHVANGLWNMGAKEWNRRRQRREKGRGKRISGQLRIPRIAELLKLQGEVRLAEDPHSSLYNTDGQIFSDCGIPVVLFMENYDIDRSGYHDQKDTMENIDLDYGTALAAIAIETVARVAVNADNPAKPS